MNEPTRSCVFDLAKRRASRGRKQNAPSSSLRHIGRDYGLCRRMRVFPIRRRRTYRANKMEKVPRREKTMAQVQKKFGQPDIEDRSSTSGPKFGATLKHAGRNDVDCRDPPHIGKSGRRRNFRSTRNSPMEAWLRGARLNTRMTETKGTLGADDHVEFRRSRCSQRYWAGWQRVFWNRSGMLTSRRWSRETRSNAISDQTV